MIARRARAISAASIADRCGSSDRPVPVTQKIRASRIAAVSSSSGAISMSGAFGYR